VYIRLHRPESRAVKDDDMTRDDSEKYPDAAIFKTKSTCGVMAGIWAHDWVQVSRSLVTPTVCCLDCQCYKYDTDSEGS